MSESMDLRELNLVANHDYSTRDCELCIHHSPSLALNQPDFLVPQFVSVSYYVYLPTSYPAQSQFLGWIIPVYTTPQPASACLPNMSQPQQHISPAVQREIDELIGEITFQRVLLESIDDTVPDRQEAELEVTNEIRNLEHQIKRLKRGLVAGTPAAARGIHDLTASQSAEDSNLASPRTKAAERSGTWMETYQGEGHV
jgi:hypothetical protein